MVVLYLSTSRTTYILHNYPHRPFACRAKLPPPAFCLSWRGTTGLLPVVEGNQDSATSH